MSTDDPLVEERPYFTPPYGSPIEEWFASDAMKHMAPGVEIFPQYEIATYSGNFRLDFLIVFDEMRVGIECDGQQFHEENRDCLRDSLILGTKQVDAIVRLRGTDIFHHANDCVYALSQLYPNMFSERGVINLGILASPEVLNYDFTSKKPWMLVRYSPEKTENEEFEDDREPPTRYIYISRRVLEYSEYYIYHTNLIWDIIKWQALDDWNEVNRHFSKFKEAIDNHIAMLNGFSQRRLLAYESIVKALDVIHYG